MMVMVLPRLVTASAALSASASRVVPVVMSVRGSGRLIVVTIRLLHGRCRAVRVWIALLTLWLLRLLLLHWVQIPVVPWCVCVLPPAPIMALFLGRILMSGSTTRWRWILIAVALRKDRISVNWWWLGMRLVAIERVIRWRLVGDWVW